MFKNWKDYFHFTRSERNGSIVLVTLIMLLVTFRYVEPYILKPQLADLHQQWDTIRKWDNEGATFSESSFANKNSSATDIQLPVILEKFNPNHLPEEKWKQFGLTEKQIRTIYNFEAKGGRFVIKADVGKIYSIDQKLLESLWPYIDLPEEREWTVKNKKEHHDAERERNMTRFPRSYSPVQPKMIELNSADTSALKSLRGIGSFYARKIIEYRQKLGGFYSASQLKEIWKMRPGLVDTISTFLIVDTMLVDRININTIDAITLSVHPYLDKNQANALIAYREQHGPFQSITDIKKCTLIDDDAFTKIQKYIFIE